MYGLCCCRAVRARWTSSCRSTAGGRQLAVRAASGTAGKMNSPEAEPRHAAPPAACRPACRGSASGEFILPAVPDAARTAVVDRRQLTGKMKSTALEKNTTGSASPRRTIVPSLATASPRQRHAREHVSNVQRGGAMSHGTTDGSRNKPQNSLKQSRFSPICCGRWLKIVLKPTKSSENRPNENSTI